MFPNCRNGDPNGLPKFSYKNSSAHPQKSDGNIHGDTPRAASLERCSMCPADKPVGMFDGGRSGDPNILLRFISDREGEGDDLGSTRVAVVSGRSGVKLLA